MLHQYESINKFEGFVSGIGNTSWSYSVTLNFLLTKETCFIIIFDCLSYDYKVIANNSFESSSNLTFEKIMMKNIWIKNYKCFIYTVITCIFFNIDYIFELQCFLLWNYLYYNKNN